MVQFKSRIVQPELLDDLTPDDAAALRNRRDIQLINTLQGNFRWIAKALKVHRKANEIILEPGAGQGELAHALRRAGVIDSAKDAWVGLDLWPRPTDWPEPWSWHQGDLQSFGRYEDYPVIVANLILHQFEDDALRKLGTIWRKTARLIIASEPLRSRRAWLGLRALWPVLNHVSRHDGAVSIEAGFRGEELSGLLGLEEPEWKIRHEMSFLGTYRMLAVRLQ